MEEKQLNDQEQFRREKLAKYKEMGVDPFGSKFEVKEHIEDVRAHLAGKTNEELEQMQYYTTVAGRIMGLRKMGKASFITIQDKTGKIQAYIGIDIVGEETYNIFRMTDIGDIVGLYGRCMLTRTGELTIRVEKYTHLTKCLRPLPEKFHGLTDTEERFRHRYVDLIMNEDSRNIAILRTKIIRAMQHYFDERGFIEVETSVLSPLLTGASARPFITHHNALDRDFYLRIATELPLKRLIVGGLERVYEIGRIFRNEGMDTKHNPESTTCELYQAYGDLQSMRELTEGVIKHIAKEVIKSDQITFGDNVIDLSKPFRWVHMVDLIKEKTGVDFWKEMTLDEAKAIAKEHHVEVTPLMTGVGHIINAFFEEFCEADLIQPTFVYGHPKEISYLTKSSADPRFTERFECFIAGFEIDNAYSELNDPIDQRQRFVDQLKAKEMGDEEANDLDEDFLEALEYGMPPCGGVGIGIDRLIM